MRPAVAEPGRVRLVGGIEGLGPLGPDLGGRAVVDRRRRVVADARVPVFVVVIREERLAEGPGVLDAAEAFGERRAVLEGLEIRLTVGVVVGRMGTAMAASDAQEGEQFRHRVRRHRRAPVGVDGELTGCDVVADHGVGDELFGQLAGLARRHAPRHHVATEDVDHHVEVVVDATFGTLQFGVGVGPGRPASLSTGGFPRPALRTGRATLTASGSPHVMPLVRVFLFSHLTMAWGSEHPGIGSG